MRNFLIKTSLFTSIIIFTLFSFSSFAFADKYGDNAYGSNGYSAPAPGGTTSGTTQAFRDKFAADQKALTVQNTTPTTTTPTPSNSLNITKTLKLKINHNDVKLLQVYLNTHGYPVSTIGAGSLGKETNYFGAKTKQAVMKFQKANGLKADGVVGPKTREKMK